eukprot:8701975-Lingulodinium_polyedra.AAC.1
MLLWAQTRCCLPVGKVQTLIAFEKDRGHSAYFGYNAWFGHNAWFGATSGLGTTRRKHTANKATRAQ